MGQCSQLQHLPAATAAAAVVVRPSRRRVLKALQALPLQALHLAYEAGQWMYIHFFSISFTKKRSIQMVHVVAHFEQSGRGAFSSSTRVSRRSVRAYFGAFVRFSRLAVPSSPSCAVPTLKLLAASDVLTSHPVTEETFTRDVIRVVSNFDHRNVLPVLVTQLHRFPQTILFVQSLPCSSTLSP